MDSVTCCSCGATIPEADARVYHESRFLPRRVGSDISEFQITSTYCPECAHRECPNRAPEPRCAGCLKVAPRSEHWPEGWIGIAADGTLVFPSGPAALTVPQTAPASRAGNEAVCSPACLATVRQRRERENATGPR